jgi:2-C-methyl-D-erythritol 4-phosphate cytidylyltransferase
VTEAGARPVIRALIPAAGQGLRFGSSVAKQYLRVAGKPVLAHAIDAVNVEPEISGITVVLSADDKVFGEMIDLQNTEIETVTGGATRAESVFNGLKSIQENHPETEWVLVHDAARPCLSRDSLIMLLEKGLESVDGAILAVPVRDTLKRSDDSGCIEATVERKGLWAAQTPQLFPLARLISAMQSALATGMSPTDEASAMEQAGANPLLVMGTPSNIKITWPDDVATAEAWFASE